MRAILRAQTAAFWRSRPLSSPLVLAPQRDHRAWEAPLTPTLGILIADVDIFAKIEGLGGRHYMDQDGNRVGGFEVKFYGPEGVLFDVPEHPWTGTEPLAVEKSEAAE